LCAFSRAASGWKRCRSRHDDQPSPDDSGCPPLFVAAEGAMPSAASVRAAPCSDVELCSNDEPRTDVESGSDDEPHSGDKPRSDVEPRLGVESDSDDEPHSGDKPRSDVEPRSGVESGSDVEPCSCCAGFTANSDLSASIFFDFLIFEFSRLLLPWWLPLPTDFCAAW
jgi:hypothetical protein